MNQKVYSILFCALFASTFVHELRAKGIGPVSSHRLDVFRERAASNQVCELQCHFESNVTVNAGLTLEVVEDVLVVANTSAHVAILINATAQIVVLLNGTSGAGVAIDLSAQTGVYIKTGLWVSANGSLESWIVSLTGGLKAIFSISGGTTFNLKKISKTIYQVINQIVGKLVLHISAQLEDDIEAGLTLVLTISKGLVGLLNGSLKGLLELVGKLTIHLTNDLAGLLNTLQGVGQVIVKLVGSLSVLIEKGVKLNLELILGASSGLEILIALVLEIGISIDISQSLGELLNDAGSFFKLIAQLGGNVSVGLNGLFSIVSGIISLVNNNATLEVVISDLIQFVAYSSQEINVDLSAQLSALLSGLVSVIEKLNLTTTLSGLVKTLKALIAGTLTIGGVNISVIIKKLLTGALKGSSTLLQVIVYVVLQLQAAIEVSKLIPSLLLVLLLKLNSSIGVRQLILIGIKVEQQGLASLKKALSGAVSLIWSLLTGNFFNVLKQIPVIGVVLSALVSALASVNSSLSLQSLLSGAANVRKLILGFIQIITGISLGVSSSIISQVKTLLEASSSISGCVKVSLSVCISSSCSS
ncbi:uncharacterized protein LOC126739601 [Anthonomus grandis grandis]|uniref:uncharacterized protein LOC126739601 n=1 Tax=Anthonomus grandis grandis TaxID=2921223 RepID=UPI002165F93C|nr:uncharacterized protein LOC126739601 [Anthonomus grandis grandis]XP_050301314.1 uncharacterized protein LOC126739601 [Anthonomus grandis grandis]